jgi:large subunit ribosomal protein L6
MHLPTMTQTVPIPSGVSATMQGMVLAVKGPKGENHRAVATKRVLVKVEGSNIVVSAKNVTKNDKRILQTNTAHIRNMVRGVAQGHVYKLKICSGHFPMSVAIKGDLFEVKNFIGEAVPRTLKINPGAKVTIQGTDITVESASKEAAGTQAAAIELLMRRPGFDPRVFQDGIYITEKDGKKV